MKMSVTKNLNILASVVVVMGCVAAVAYLTRVALSPAEVEERTPEERALEAIVRARNTSQERQLAGKVLADPRWQEKTVRIPLPDRKAPVGRTNPFSASSL